VVCFAFQFLQLVFPDIASNVGDLVAEILKQLAETVEPLECAEFETLDLSWVHEECKALGVTNKRTLVNCWHMSSRAHDRGG
jgi:hypothetical protein